MEHSLEQLKKALREMKLTTDEKSLLKARLTNFMTTYQGAQKIVSPFISHPLFIRPLQFVALVLIFVLSGGMGLSYASTDALPGEPLYSFKVNVAEEIKSAIKAPVAKADYERERIDNRLDEIAVLALTGKLNEATKEEAQTQIVKQTEKAQKSAQALGVEQPSVELELKAKLESSLATRTQVLLDIKEAKNINGELGDIVATVKATTHDLALEKQVVEARVKKDVGETTQKNVEIKLKEVEEKFATLKGLRENEESTSVTAENTDADSAILFTMIDDTTTQTEITLTEEDSIDTIPDETLPPLFSWSELNQQVQLIEGWYAEMAVQLEEKQYGEALVLLQKIEQAIDETLLLIDLKKEFSVETNSFSEDSSQNIDKTVHDSEQSGTPSALPATTEKTIEASNTQQIQGTTITPTLLR